MVPSPSPAPPVVPEPKLGSVGLLPPETLSSEVDPAVRGRKGEENQAAAAWSLEPIDEAAGNEGKKQKVCKHGEEHASPWQSAVPGAPIFVGDKTANVVAPEQRKRKRMPVKEQKQSSQLPLLFDVHPQGRKKAAKGPKCENVAVRSSTHMPSNREIIRMRIEARKQQPLPEGFLGVDAIAANPSTNSIEKNSNCSSPLWAFFHQFCYESDRQRNHNSPPFHKPSDRPARSLPGSFLTFEPSQLAANGTSKAANTQILNASAFLSQEVMQTKDSGKLEKKTNDKKQKKPKPVLTAAEKQSDKYRRVPLDQLVPPPRSPHKLLQEKYSSEPWKVIVICMPLNRAQGNQVRKKVKGFFEQYPDPQTACRADSAKMTKYLKPLGLHKVRTIRIQRCSKDYVEKEWTYITELYGVGKYAADAYAIFCAGRAREVEPEDHKLVDYWNYVCFELPLIQGSGNEQEPGATDQLEKIVPKLLELDVCC